MMIVENSLPCSSSCAHPTLRIPWAKTTKDQLQIDIKNHFSPINCHGWFSAVRLSAYNVNTGTKNLQFQIIYFEYSPIRGCVRLFALSNKLNLLFCLNFQHICVPLRTHSVRRTERVSIRFYFIIIIRARFMEMFFFIFMLDGNERNL